MHVGLLINRYKPIFSDIWVVSKSENVCYVFTDKRSVDISYDIDIQLAAVFMWKYKERKGCRANNGSADELITWPLIKLPVYFNAMVIALVIRCTEGLTLINLMSKLLA